MHDEHYLKAIKKLVTKTEKIGDCFIWTGYKDRDGYGTIRYGGYRGSILVHRLAAHLFRGMPLWDGKTQTLHICKSRACWNPEHTYDGTHKDNMKDRKEIGNYLDPYGRSKRWIL